VELLGQIINQISLIVAKLRLWSDGFELLNVASITEFVDIAVGLIVENP
jgi:hypothetical protein